MLTSLEQFRQIVPQILNDYVAFASKASSPYGKYEYQVVVDREADHYLVMSHGWEQHRRRYHACIIHLDLVNGKIWIQEDGTPYGIAEDLLKAGVPKDKIVLGFKSPALRKYTEFAVA